MIINLQQNIADLLQVFCLFACLTAICVLCLSGPQNFQLIKRKLFNPPSHKAMTETRVSFNSAMLQLTCSY